jgi:hypothetical protein
MALRLDAGETMLEQARLSARSAILEPLEIDRL